MCVFFYFNRYHEPSSSHSQNNSMTTQKFMFTEAVKMVKEFPRRSLWGDSTSSLLNNCIFISYSRCLLPPVYSPWMFFFALGMLRQLSVFNEYKCIWTGTFYPLQMFSPGRCFLYAHKAI